MKNSPTLEEENDLLHKAKDIIKLTKMDSNYNNLKILKILESEVLSFNSKSSEKIIEEFNKIFNKILKDVISFKNESNDGEIDLANYVRLFLKLATRSTYMDMI